jgi:adenosylmethionine-8-amino-7-oxononanoate aminotransferase
MNNNANTEPSHLFSLDLSRDYPTLVRGEGVYVYDDQGKQYLDAIAGIAVVAIGYGRERVAKTIAEQAMKLPYVASNIFSNEPAIKLADQLARLMPGDCNSIHFTSGGSEAVEAAIKICRQYQYERGKGDKHVLIARWSSYHGATLGALSATGFASRRKKFLPLLLDWPHIPPAYCYRCPFDSDYPGCDLACARSLEEKINQIGQEQVMGFIAEPVVGAAGGALVPPLEYWPRVREICTLYDVLFIADEVLTGFGRTGKPFAVNHWGISPDMITMAKGLSSGYAPLGAIGISQKIRAVFQEKQVPFDHIFTFSSNPISTAAASEALKIWEEEQLSLRAEKTGEYMLRQLETLKKYEMVGDVRGLGLMAGIEFVQNRGTKEPFPIEKGVAKLVGKAALQKGLVTYPASGIIDGVKGDIISLFPPLVFTPHHVDEMVEKLKAALEEVERMLRINR